MGEVSTPTDRATMSRGLAFLFGAGASLVGVSLLLPHSRNTNDLSLLVAVSIAFVAAVGLLRFAGQFSVRALEVVLMLGTVLITVCVIYGGDSASAYGGDGYGVEEEEAQPAFVEQRRLDETEQIGRNDPCWCGSGKKYKKCHGA